MNRAKRQPEAKKHKHRRPPIRRVIWEVNAEPRKAARMKPKTTESMAHIAWNQRG